MMSEKEADGWEPCWQNGLLIKKAFRKLSAFLVKVPPI